MIETGLSRMTRVRHRRHTSAGFTMVELMFALVVLAVLVAIAVPSFSSRIRTVRSDMAAQAFARAVSSARALASQTGKRTDLYVNSTPTGVTGCDSPAWVIVQGTTVLYCLKTTDFTSRYQGTTFTSTGSVTYLPTGIGMNTSDQTYTFSSGDVTKQVKVNAGGTADIL